MVFLSSKTLSFLTIAHSLFFSLKLANSLPPKQQQKKVGNSEFLHHDIRGAASAVKHEHEIMFDFMLPCSRSLAAGRSFRSSRRSFSHRCSVRRSFSRPSWACLLSAERRPAKLIVVVGSLLSPKSSEETNDHKSTHCRAEPEICSMESISFPIVVECAQKERVSFFFEPLLIRRLSVLLRHHVAGPQILFLMAVFLRIVCGSKQQKLPFGKQQQQWVDSEWTWLGFCDAADSSDDKGNCYILFKGSEQQQQQQQQDKGSRSWSRPEDRADMEW